MSQPPSSSPPSVFPFSSLCLLFWLLSSPFTPFYPIPSLLFLLSPFSLIFPILSPFSCVFSSLPPLTHIFPSSVSPTYPLSSQNNFFKKDRFSIIFTIVQAFFNMKYAIGCFLWIQQALYWHKWLVQPLLEWQASEKRCRGNSGWTHSFPWYPKLYYQADINTNSSKVLLQPLLS